MKIKKICICFLAIISILFLKNYCQAQSIVYNTTDFKIVGTELIEYTGNEEDIIVPQNVKKIGNYAFENCKSMKTIKLPDNLEKIGAGAFSGCENLIELEIPRKVSVIGSGYSSGTGTVIAYAFKGCKSLERFKVQSTNLFFCTEDGVLFNNDKTLLLSYPASKEETIYNVPETVQALDDYSFSYNKNLTKVTIPKNVLGVYTNRITNWFGSAFYMCEKLEEISIDMDNEKIVSEDGIIFSKDLKTLLFYPPAKKGTSYSIPDMVTEIGCYAFSGNKELTQISIHKNVEKISVNELFKDEECDSFISCFKLTDISVSDENKKYSSEDGVLYNKDKTTIYTYPSGKYNNEFSIPYTVKKVAGMAFYNVLNLEKINVHENLYDINECAFVECNKLMEIAVNEKNSQYLSDDGKLYLIRENKVIWESDIKFKLQTSKVEVYVGKGEQIICDATYPVTYKSQNVSVATVSDDGIVTGKKAGNTVITLDSGVRTLYVKVTVREELNKSGIILDSNMKLSAKKVTIKKGAKISVFYTSVKGKISFKSANKKIATVSSKGVIKAKRKGKTVILIKVAKKTVKLNIIVR